jgi:hypothetical protein
MVPVPASGKVVEIFSTLHGAITVADAAITCSIGATEITGGGLTIATSGSAAGDVDRSYPTGANAVLEGEYLKATSDGGSTDAARLTVTFVIRKTQVG